MVNRLRQEKREDGQENNEEGPAVLDKVLSDKHGAWGLASQAREVDYEGPIRLMVPGNGLNGTPQTPSTDAQKTRPKQPKPKRVHWADQMTKRQHLQNILKPLIR